MDYRGTGLVVCGFTLQSQSAISRVESGLEPVSIFVDSRVKSYEIESISP
jgi:hypothetical protein